MIADRPLKLLLIEDDEPTALALRVLFHQRAGLEVTWASNVEDARVMLREGPDSVLLDLMLPGGNGEEILSEIRDRGGTQPRVVIVTALPEGSSRVAKAHAMGPDALIHKPYEIENLMAAVKGEAPWTTPHESPDPDPR